MRGQLKAVRFDRLRVSSILTNRMGNIGRESLLSLLLRSKIVFILLACLGEKSLEEQNSQLLPIKMRDLTQTAAAHMVFIQATDDLLLDALALVLLNADPEVVVCDRLPFSRYQLDELERAQDVGQVVKYLVV